MNHFCTVNICSLIFLLGCIPSTLQFFITLLERDSMVDPLRIRSCAKQILLSDTNFLFSDLLPEILAEDARSLAEDAV
jgi:hypothetical protein